LYKVSLITSQDTQKVTADTIAEALAKFKPCVVKSKSTLIASLGDSSTTKYLYPLLVRRMFANPTYRVILGKQLTAAIPALRVELPKLPKKAAKPRKTK
jgi:hypothetical protein